MSELKALRLAAAATQYNVGMDHIVEKLKQSNLVVDNKPTTKLTVEMIAVLDKAFNVDRAIRQEVVVSTLVEKPKKEVIEFTEPVVKAKAKEDEKEIIIKSNIVAPKPEPVKEVVAEPVKEVAKEPIAEVAKEKEPEQVKAPEPVIEAIPEVKAPVAEPPSDTITADSQRLEGPKIMGKIDLNPKKKKKEEPVAAPVKAEEPAKPIEEPAKKEAPVETPATPVQEPVAEVKAPVEEQPAVTTPPVVAEDANHIRMKRTELTGPKIMGKIVLEDPRKREAAKTGAGQGQAGAGKPGDPKRPRKRIAMPARTPAQFDTEHEKKVRSFREKEATRRTTPLPNTQQQPKEITEKEIEDKIKATMAKIQSQTSKSDRSKMRRGKREANQEKLAAQQDAVDNTKIQVTEFISVSELASLMNVSPVKVISTCMNLGVIVSINQRLDAEIIELVAGEHGFQIEFISVQDNASFEDEVADRPEDLQDRAPIVTIMGHVDHGKTSLLDYIRKTKVADKEAGGITQHIGAYEVVTDNNKRITFLDTPGHEAFTAMRARGAKVTDVAVIVVAADDAVMPQTKEAINHAQSAGVPMIFAINKIDKDGANSDRIREQLASMNLLVEEWGGKFQSQEISAKKGLNIEALLDKILLESELLELKANPNKLAIGSVIEASLDKGRGYLATLLVQSGKLEVGALVVCGPYFGKVKAMFDHTGKRVKTAGPSTPVQVLGLNGAPQAGEKFKVFDDEQEAKAVAAKRAQLEREQGIRTKKHITLDEIGRRLALGTFKELSLIIKGDVDGSVEALADSLLKLSTEEIHVRVIHKAVGAISESDVNLAVASDAIIIGFNVRPSVNAKKIADNENIEIKLYSIIYNAIEEVKSAMEGLLEPKVEEKIIGNLEVREVFNITKVGTIAGCMVRDGRVLRNSKIRIIRDGIVMHQGTLSALKRFKDDAKEVVSGFECGVQIKDYQDIKTGDTIEVFEEIEVQRKL